MLRSEILKLRDTCPTTLPSPVNVFSSTIADNKNRARLGILNRLGGLATVYARYLLSGWITTFCSAASKIGLAALIKSNALNMLIRFFSWVSVMVLTTCRSALSSVKFEVPSSLSRSIFNIVSNQFLI